MSLVSVKTFVTLILLVDSTSGHILQKLNHKLYILQKKPQSLFYLDLKVLMIILIRLKIIKSSMLKSVVINYSTAQCIKLLTRLMIDQSTN